MLRTAEELAQLDADELADVLTDIARQCRAALAQGDRVTPLRQLRAVQAAAEGLGGERLRLVEVSAAFLKTMAQANFGRLELAIREFMEDFPDEGPSFLSEVVDRSASESILERVSTSLKSGIERLRELGIIRVERGRLDLRPEWRIVVRDLLEPPVFRHWREVDQARGNLLLNLNRLDEGDAVVALAAQFGVGTDQAQRFLKRSPIRTHRNLGVVLSARSRTLRHASLPPSFGDTEAPVAAQDVGIVANSPVPEELNPQSAARAGAALPSLMN